MDKYMSNFLNTEKDRNRMLTDEGTKSVRMFHYRPICRICRRELPLSRSLVVVDTLRFCKEHWRDYEIRQREGVTSQDLNSDWSDTLGNWHERPTELDEEVRTRRPSTTPLYFWQRYEDWVLFIRGYSTGLSHELRSRGILGMLPGKRSRFALLRAEKRSFVEKLLHGDGHRVSHRASDCLAVNLQTGAIRRFVDVQGETVLDDLEGIRPAPYQAELASFWGKPEPTGIEERFKQQYMDESHHIRIPDLVRIASFPIYGFFDNASDFSVCSLGVSGHVWEGISEISFVFSSPRYQQVRESFQVSSSDVRQRHILYDPECTVNDLFMSYDLSEEEREQIDHPSLWEGETIIDDVTFTGEIHHWSQPYQLSLFRLKSEKTLLNGNACGPSLEELLRLLKELHIINEQESLLEQYQRELDKERQRLFRQTE